MTQLMMEARKFAKITPDSMTDEEYAHAIDNAEARIEYRNGHAIWRGPWHRGNKSPVLQVLNDQRVCARNFLYRDAHQIPATTRVVCYPACGEPKCVHPAHQARGLGPRKKEKDVE